MSEITNQFSNTYDEHIANDIFAISTSPNEYLIYSPIRQIVFKANSSALSQIKEHLDNKKTENQSEVISQLESIGFFTPLSQSEILKRVPLQGSPQTTLTISLTYSCNLKCVYCYASAGEQLGRISEPAMLSAIDYIAQNIKTKGYKTMRLSFHGTGEATVAWDLLEKGVEYAEQVVSRLGLELYTTVTTNATKITPDRADYFLKHNIHVSVSLDGYDEIQNAQRPFRNGKGSFQAVMQSLNVLKEKGIYTAFRATVLPESTDKMEQTVEFLAEDIFKNGGKIHFEPVEKCGRALENDSADEIDANLFLENYKRAVELGNKKGIQVKCSADFRLGYRRFFCSANGRIFLILPTGEISSCTRVTTQDDMLSDTFFFGKYDEKQNLFNIDETKLEKLVSINVDTNPKCEKCFCKYHCGGQCLAASMSSNEHWEKMCYITRELGKWRLMKLADG